MNDIPFGTRYYVEGPQAGLWIANENRAIGGHFAILAMEQGTWYSQKTRPMVPQTIGRTTGTG